MEPAPSCFVLDAGEVSGVGLELAGMDAKYWGHPLPLEPTKVHA